MEENAVTVKFSSNAMAKQFMSWMDGSGEQCFPEWYEEHDLTAPMPRYDYKKFTIDYTDLDRP